MFGRKIARNRKILVIVMPNPSFAMPDLIGHLALSGEFSKNVQYS